VLAATLELYQNRLLNDARALAYLARRGFSQDVVERWRLGFAAGDQLVTYLVWRRLPVSSARRLGLLDVDGRERMADRIIIPEMRQGQPIWLIGRLLITATRRISSGGYPVPSRSSAAMKPLLTCAL
jgi:DNA primase